MVDVENLLGPRLNQKHLNFKLNCKNDVPQYLMGDQERLEQVIINIVGNSIKFTPNHGEICIDVEYIGEDDGIYRLKFHISDTGPGIAQENIDKIFQRFEQETNSIKKKYGGSGLGLNISQLFVEKMGGSISVESELGNGVTFSFDVLLEKPEIEPKNIVVFTNDEGEVLVKLIDNLLNDGHTVHMVDDKEHLLKSIRDKVADVVLINAHEKRSEVENLIDQVDSKADVDCFVVNARDGNLVHLVPSYKNEQILDDSTMDAVLNRISHGDQKSSSSEDEDISGAPGKQLDSSLKVLIVDDGPDIQMIIKAYFRIAGLEVDAADNGLDAYHKFIKGDYDLILMDIQMPVMDGYETAEKIRKWEKDHNVSAMPIIALTATSFKEDIERIYNAGFNFHLAKPIEKDKLFESVIEYSKERKAS